MDKKFLYFFGAGQTEGNKDLKPILGGKGAYLAEMAKIDIPIPPGFTIIADACDLYYKNNQKLPEALVADILAYLERLEKVIGKRLGDPVNPLLLSVRSGAAVSMPGMMDTVLNLGLNRECLDGLIKKTNNPRFVWDSYRRFIQMFSNIVMDTEHHNFEKAIDEVKKAKGVKLDTELDVEDLKVLVDKYMVVVKNSTHRSFPEDTKEQLLMAIEAVCRSWNNPRAISYRRLNDIRGLAGTAVNVQSMVFGNMGETSGTGVAFSRDPSTGENKITGECLMNAQGEDVVAGIRTPLKIEELGKYVPEAYQQFKDIVDKLEHHFKDMQDVEFTIEEGKLYFLQCRSGKRSAAAAIKIALDMADAGFIKKEDAILRVDANSLNQLLHHQIDPKTIGECKLLGKGLPASPGAAVGQVVFDPDTAVAWKEQGKKVILVRLETSPEDIEGMDAAAGILTCRGGLTSHAAVVARGMGKCCVCGMESLNLDEHKKTVTVGETVFKEGDFITLNGSTGQVYLGAAKLVEPDLNSGEFHRLMEWADTYRKLKVRANADVPRDAIQAVKFGAEGIGLCRTEHMFFQGERIKRMREMILSSNYEGRKAALDKLFVMQKEDFKGLFEAMGDRPVTIRLLDPPLHEFLPQDAEEINEIAKELGVTSEVLRAKISELHEFNPMLGHRGCRLGITYPEISEMQARAIFEAAAETNVLAEVMVPLVGFTTELKHQKEVIIKVHAEVEAKFNKKINYLFGTMIEVPRGALCAKDIAKDAEFFSFGTNDLTQMGCGFSRDDAAKFLKLYLEKNILEKDPFQVIDREGVGQLMQIACNGGRATRPDIKLGICGEHGGEPNSVEFCHLLGLSYVSCSPFRVPIARLAAAQAAIRFKHGELSAKANL